MSNPHKNKGKKHWEKIETTPELIIKNENKYSRKGKNNDNNNDNNNNNNNNVYDDYEEEEEEEEEEKEDIKMTTLMIHL